MKKLIVLAAVATLGMAGAAFAAGDAAAGKAKASGCGGCHGQNGEGVKPNPPLAGRKEDEMVQAMKDYKSGKHPHAIMKAMMGSMSDQDIANLAAYYAAMKPK